MKQYVFILILILSFSSFGQHSLAGFRGVQIRSDKVVTAWLGYMATTDSSILYDTSQYAIISPNDADYKEDTHPTKIARFSKGSRSANGPADWRPLSDQFMHLYVDKPFKPGKRYIIKISEKLIPRDLARTFQFSIDDTPNPSFKLNQVGYSNTATTKHVYLSSYLGDGKPVDLSGFKTFFIIDEFSTEKVFSGPIEFVSDKDPHGLDMLYRLDISDFTREGQFYIQVDGLGRSYTFLNGPKAVKSMFKTISSGLYFQRCGTKIEKKYGGPYARPMAHNKVYVTKKNIVHPWHIEVDPSDPAAGDYYVPDGPREIHGGHYDAGDFDTRLTHFVVSNKLMMLYEACPEKFRDGQAWIPERDNGIPDILDEAAWSLLHLEMLQDLHGEVRGDYGAVPPGMESWTHPPKYPATGDGDMLPYYMRKASPYSTFCGAAIFAQAARVLKDADPEHAATFLDRAKAAYAWAENNKDVKWDPENPDVLPLDWEEVYDDGTLNTAWCWAAAELFSTTGEKSYWNDFEKRYDNVTTIFKQPPWKALYPIIVTEQKHADSNIVMEIKNKLLNEAESQLEWIDEIGRTGYRASLPGTGNWGFCNPICWQELLWMGYYITKEQKYRDAIAMNVDFTLGMNPSEISWMTHAGTVYPMDPLSSNSKFDGVVEPIPGIVIFGPTENWKHEQNPLYPDGETMGFYRRISDVWNYVEGCEYVVDEQQTNMYVSVGILLE